MDSLPNELLYYILSYCDSFKDYGRWSLVSRRWNSVSSDCIENVLKVVLNKDIDRLLGNSKSDYKYHYNKLMINNQKRIRSIFYIYWGSVRIPSPIKTIQLYNNDRKIKDITHEECFSVYPYFYASRTPIDNGVGYVCVMALGDVNTVLLKCNTPLLVAISSYDESLSDVDNEIMDDIY